MTMSPIETRLTEALHEIAERLPEPTSEIQAPRPASIERRRRTGRLALVAAALVVVAGLATAVLVDDGDGGDRVVTSGDVGPATVVDPVVLSSAAGVSMIVNGHEQRITTEPAGLAFGLGEDLAVFQSDPDGYGAAASGPVRMWSAGELRTLPSDEGAIDVGLLDAEWIDGEPYALLRERFGGVSPDDTFEALIRIELRTGAREQLVRTPAWESGMQSARLLPDGDIIGLMSGEAHLFAVRWSGAQQSWSTEVGIDTTLDFASLGDVHAVLGLDDNDRLGLRTIDAETGEVTATTSLDPSVPAPDLRCRDWLDDATLLCAVPDGDPVALSTTSGAVRTLPSTAGAIPTRVRVDDATTEPPPTAITVSPSAPLVRGTNLTLALTGLDALRGQDITLQVTRGEPLGTGPRYAYAFIGDGRVDGDGAAVVDVSLPNHLSGEDDQIPLEPGGEYNLEIGSSTDPSSPTFRLPFEPDAATPGTDYPVTARRGSPECGAPPLEVDFDGSVWVPDSQEPFPAGTETFDGTFRIEADGTATFVDMRGVTTTFRTATGWAC